MSTEVISGQLPEHKPEPMAEAGCEDKMNRNVQGTVASTGFAELRSRAEQAKKDAWKRAIDAQKMNYGYLASNERGSSHAFDLVLRWLDELGADAKDASSAGERNSTS